MNEKQQAIQEFEEMRQGAELKALLNISLRRPLTDHEYNKVMKLKESLGYNE